MTENSMPGRSDTNEIPNVFEPASLSDTTNLADIEWASAFLPVLAIVQGIDLATNATAGVSVRVVNRTDLAARLGVKGNKPIGEQLVAKGLLSFDAGRRLDNGMHFTGRLFNLCLRIDDAVRNLSDVLEQFKSAGFIEEIIGVQQCNGYFHLKLTTRKFAGLSRSISSTLPWQVVLLSINDSILYV